MRRRTFLAASSAALLLNSTLRADDSAKRTVAVIGHTGRGSYGHGLDTVWHQIPETEIVAVADANEPGLAREVAKLKLERGYSDYRKMLQETRPEFVAVGPRHPDQHQDMILAAIESGAKGIYCEKPFCRTPAEADTLIAAAAKQGTKVAVAHRNRYQPALAKITELLDSGEMGRLLEIRGKGKGDRRGGGEDLWVLGSHVLNLFTYFSGAPKTVSALLRKEGRPVTADDVISGAEGLGPLAADEVRARYEMEDGTIAYYDSVANDGTAPNGYCLELIGSKGVVTLHIDRTPIAHFTRGNPFQASPNGQSWIPITSAGVGEKEPDPELIRSVHNHVLPVRDLIAAVDEDRAPICDIHEGAATVEMICGVFQSHRENGRSVSFPLSQRDNALADW
ncbi:Gfo/Idh/MocA family protein [Bremerella alba]|nr:Gfo/Idh/MocA family oxidoreductase [Bremerella alba]